MSDNFFEFNSPFSAQMTPEEIEKMDFVSSLRGFDQNDVRSFLRKVAGEFRAALQEAQLAKIALEEARNNAAAVTDRQRHADIEIDEARRQRIEAADALEEAQALHDKAEHNRQEAESALRQIRELKEAKAAAPVVVEAPDPYELVAQQVTAIMRAAEGTAVELRTEAEDLVKAAQLDSESLLNEAEMTAAEIQAAAEMAIMAMETDAQEKANSIIEAAQAAAAEIEASAQARAAELEQSSRLYADDQEARATLAQAQVENMMESMQNLQLHINQSVSQAMTDLQITPKTQEIHVVNGVLS